MTLGMLLLSVCGQRKITDTSPRFNVLAKCEEMLSQA